MWRMADVCHIEYASKLLTDCYIRCELSKVMSDQPSNSRSQLFFMRQMGQKSNSIVIVFNLTLDVTADWCRRLLQSLLPFLYSYPIHHSRDSPPVPGICEIGPFMKFENRLKKERLTRKWGRVQRNVQPRLMTLGGDRKTFEVARIEATVVNQLGLVSRRTP